MPQYKVVELREGLLGGKMSGDKLEKVLNEHGSQGWNLKAITRRRARRCRGRPGDLRAALTPNLTPHRSLYSW